MLWQAKKHQKFSYYINLFIWHLGVPGILQYDNRREFKGVLLLFLKKYNIKLINGRPQTPQTQGVVEQANAAMRDKIAKLQAVNSTVDWAD